jgi:hypothetical protein
MTKRLPFALAAAALATAGAAACVQPNDDPHPVAKVLPKAEDVRIKLPDSASSRSNVVGELAEWYVATRDVTRMLNGGTAAVLVLVHTIVQLPPSHVDGDTYTWGPGHDALDPAEWRLVVTDLPDGSYDWHLDGRNLTAPGATFETIVDGNAREGVGRFTLDFDAAERVNPRENDGRGQIGAAYDLGARTLDLAVDSVEDHDGTPTAIHYDYRYGEQADGAGDMVFSIYGDTDDVGPLPEQVTLRSRWQATGAGRADLRLHGGDTTVELTASECWDTSFLRVFYADSLAWRPSEGAVTACAFADQDLP